MLIKHKWIITPQFYSLLHIFNRKFQFNKNQQKKREKYSWHLFFFGWRMRFSITNLILVKFDSNLLFIGVKSLWSWPLPPIKLRLRSTKIIDEKLKMTGETTINNKLSNLKRAKNREGIIRINYNFIFHFILSYLSECRVEEMKRPNNI
jgi:hypothetical protein